MAKKIWLATANGNWGTTGNWQGGTPVAGDDAIIPPNTPAITAGLDQSAVALASVFIQAGHRLTIGTAAAPLQLNCTSLRYAGDGQSYIDLGASAAPVSITNTAPGSDTVQALYLKGSGITTLAISGGNVALAGLPGETASPDVIRVRGNGTRLLLGAGVTFTTLEIASGIVTAYCELAAVNVYGGELKHEGGEDATAVTVYGGVANLNSEGQIDALVMNGGRTIALEGLPRVFDVVQQNHGAQFEYDPALVTINTHTPPAFPIRLNASVIT